MRDDLLQYLLLKEVGSAGAVASAQLWLQIAFLVCLFATAVLRPEAIRAKALFRGACVLFVLALLISPTMNFLLGYVMNSSGGLTGPSLTRGGSQEAMLLVSAPSLLASVLFGLSVICAFLSLGLLPPSSPAATGQRVAAAETRPVSAEVAQGKATASPPVHPLDEPD